jgi:putative CocE/NonD family hydrolase
MEYAPGVDVVKDVRIQMRDGVVLAADLYTPQEARDTPLPVVIDYIPYRKDEVAAGVRWYSYLPQNGYIVARVDIRGTGASEGYAPDEYVAQEQADGFDTIEWLAEQPFCDGNVNMMGISYGGFTALQVATTQPPHLRSIIPIDFTDDRYRDDCHYVGGHMRMYYDVSSYGIAMVASNALPPDPQWAEDWAERWQEHLDRNEPYLLKWLRHQTDGPYWRQGSVGDIAERITCPVFMIGGWADGYHNTPFRLYEMLTVPRRVIIGPWHHATPDNGVPGPRIDYLPEVVRWLDHWCKGRDTGVLDEPPIVVYEQEYQRPNADRITQTGKWRAERSWPAPGASAETLYLGVDNRLEDSVGGDGADQLEYDATVGTRGGLWSAGVPFGLTGDQRLDEAASLTYTSKPLESDLHILGRARVELHVSSSATVIGFAVSLSDVSPDGHSHLVAKGILNATRRNSLTDPEPLVPGEVYSLIVDVDCTAWRFAEGHRIRVSIANADWPNVWPTPEPATSQIWRGTTRPSRISLPAVPAQGSADPPTFPAAPESPVPHREKVNPPIWRTVRDGFSGEAWATFSYATSERVNSTTVITNANEFESHVDPDDPANASARGSQTRTIHRPSGTIGAKAVVSVRGAATRFHVNIDLVVVIDDVEHHSRQWTESIPRNLL